MAWSVASCLVRSCSHAAKSWNTGTVWRPTSTNRPFSGTVCSRNNHVWLANSCNGPLTVGLKGTRYSEGHGRPLVWTIVALAPLPGKQKWIGDDDDDDDDESIKLMFACCYSYKQSRPCWWYATIKVLLQSVVSLYAVRCSNLIDYLSVSRNGPQPIRNRFRHLLRGPSVRCSLLQSVAMISCACTYIVRDCLTLL